MLFISSQKLFSLLRYLIFCSDILVMYKNDLIGKKWLISKFMTLEPDKQLQHTYCAISQEVKAIRQWNLVS